MPIYNSLAAQTSKFSTQDNSQPTSTYLIGLLKLFILTESEYVRNCVENFWLLKLKPGEKEARRCTKILLPSTKRHVSIHTTRLPRSLQTLSRKRNSPQSPYRPEIRNIPSLFRFKEGDSRATVSRQLKILLVPDVLRKWPTPVTACIRKRTAGYTF